MTKIILTLLLTCGCLLPTGDISMYGLRIHDDQNVLADIKLTVVAKEAQMTKFRTENGNDFSVTTDKGKLVYLENDWLQDPQSRQPLFSEFSFGKTTLSDIRSKFGTNGFTYKSRGPFKTNTHLIMFNCFEFDSPNNEILVTITKVALNENLTAENLASKCKLDALIIADKSYLDKTWGNGKVLDRNYKKIQP
ncbi:MAG: hypothetical protein RLZZ107_913 [Bacteroidota bacterium]